jgi:hypothetical protein
MRIGWDAGLYGTASGATGMDGYPGAMIRGLRFGVREGERLTRSRVNLSGMEEGRSGIMSGYLALGWWLGLRYSCNTRIDIILVVSLLC